MLFSSLQNRLILSVSATILLTLITFTGTIGYFGGQQLEQNITQQLKNSLTAKRVILKSQIEDYFNTITQQITTTAQDAAFTEQTTLFIQAFNRVADQHRLSAEQSKQAVSDYYNVLYQTEFLRLNKLHANIPDLLADLAPVSLLLQHDYIATNPHPLGSKNALLKAEHGTDYDQVHARYHPSLSRFQQTFGYYDLFIADAQNGNVVYSVFKEIDFATSLLDGPHADSGIGEAFRTALTLSPGEYYLSDFAPYGASYNNTASFIASPIYQGENLIAVLIFQMPINRINNIMTVQQKWIDYGLGETGKVYLVGSDQTLRNDSRFFIEDPQGYLDIINDLSVDTANNILARNTSIALQPVDSVGVQQAILGNTGFDTFKDYREMEVLSSYAPLQVGHMTWAILAEIDIEEAYQPLRDLNRQLLWMIGSLTVVLILLGVMTAISIATSMLKPLKRMGDQFEDLAKGQGDLTYQLPKSGIIEIDRIGEHFNLFNTHLRDIVNLIKSRANTLTSASEELSVSASQTHQTAVEQNTSAAQVKAALGRFTEANKQVSDGLLKSIVNVDEARKLVLINQTLASASEEQGATCQSIDRNMDGVIASSEELTASAAQMAAASQDLADVAVQLQDTVIGFKS